MFIVKYPQLIGYFSPSYVFYFVQKYVLGHIFGDFFTSASGHPADNLKTIFIAAAGQSKSMRSQKNEKRWILEILLLIMQKSSIHNVRRLYNSTS
jgi:hypothetical protein